MWKFNAKIWKYFSKLCYIPRNLIRQYLNEIILLKLKILSKFWKFYCKISIKYKKFIAKIWKCFKKLCCIPRNLIRQYVNEIILLKLKILRKFWNFYCKNSINIENLLQKFGKKFKTFIKISANFILKFIKLILKFQLTLNLKYNASKDFGTFHMYTYLLL